MALSDYLTKMTQMQTLGGTQPMQSPIGQPPVAKSKNEKLAYMLYALGGALRGDKNFVQNTLALQQMEEGKKKQEAQKKKYEDFLAGLEDGSFKDLAKAMGPEKLDALLLERFKADQPKEMTVADYKAYLAEKIAKGEQLSPQDLQLEAYLQNLDVYERRTRGIPPRGGQIQQEFPDVSNLSIEDIRATYPKGTELMYQGTKIEVD